MNAVDTAGAQVGHLVRAPKTAELIAEQLRRRIVRGELAVGQYLAPEQQLMAQFGVSRPTLREAFRILETEGWVSIRTRRMSAGSASTSSASTVCGSRRSGPRARRRSTA